MKMPEVPGDRNISYFYISKLYCNAYMYKNYHELALKVVLYKILLYGFRNHFKKIKA